jgi:hypothetical protein
MDDSPPSIPESDPAPPVPTSVAEAEATADLDLSALPEEHRGIVRRLHRRVTQAVRTIEELRAENERLRRRIEELEAGPTVPEDESLFTLDEPPDALRDRITAFIDAIDTYLDAAPDADATSDAASPPSAEDEPSVEDPTDA